MINCSFTDNSPDSRGVMECNYKPIKCFNDFVCHCGLGIFIYAVVVTSVLILIVVALLVVIGCLVVRYRRRLRMYSLQDTDEDGSEKKGEKYKMVEKGEDTNVIKGKTQKDDTGEEDFIDAMYATVECTPEPDSKAAQKGGKGQKMAEVDLTAHSYDIITHEGQERGSSNNSKQAGRSGKASKKSEAVLEEEPATQALVSAEYAVPDKSKKKTKPATNAELSTTSAREEYNKLVHTTSKSLQQQLKVQPVTSLYSEISDPEETRRKSASLLEPDDKKRQRRARTSSPPEEPPPLPPPFTDDGDNSISAAAALKQKKVSANAGIGVNKTDNSKNVGSLYCDIQSDKSIVSQVGVDTAPLYDDVVGFTASEPHQEMYMNVAKR